MSTDAFITLLLALRELDIHNSVTPITKPRKATA